MIYLTPGVSLEHSVLDSKCAVFFTQTLYLLENFKVSTDVAN